ncbi:methylated-DNA--[protein]-cysteine S-methyltransferase [Actinoplanes teichomyceticus]|uniref:Methylated-DNA-[protein]-cysteine S-methyltransferase n=1 Tax=Actinoplanes teichomyceticus TaxID=1867 RepID=A0A561WPG4_ACTTI|nr:methylated-DNA--[protein]-cysteine S-methyltransferase [Actinoplanes teichomyceticus]TWG25766.1 methylated-DNA-[protein]-cysteine S-methyltransferase [Actinoplanes teichomyceticus]GIF10841.1 putative methylated-DNA:protein-cysteine methyltransferase [Actinoplanes teichomyceticus]
MLRHSTMDTPAGPFTLVVADSGAVRASGFTTDVPELIRLVHPSLVEPAEAADDVGPAQAAVRAYFDGDLLALDSVAVQQRTGGVFLAHAWQVMREIKPGDPVTYSRYAELAGRPTAIRAAAAACARNAVALIVPCHRVLRTDGSLGGYRWGLPVKSWLLEHESAR